MKLSVKNSEIRLAFGKFSVLFYFYLTVYIYLFNLLAAFAPCILLSPCGHHSPVCTPLKTADRSSVEFSVSSHFYRATLLQSAILRCRNFIHLNVIFVQYVKILKKTQQVRFLVELLWICLQLVEQRIHNKSNQWSLSNTAEQIELIFGRKAPLVQC